MSCTPGVQVGFASVVERTVGATVSELIGVVVVLANRDVEKKWRKFDGDAESTTG